MISNEWRVLAIFAGAVRPLGAKEIPSALVKSRMHEQVTVNRLGLQGDSQADLAVHGGPDKAVYAYPASNYDLWRDEFPEHWSIWGLGALGENLALAGVNESEVCIGDVFRAGPVRFQVTQPRKPCFKLALRYNNDQRIASRMVREGRTGWYFRVLQEGGLSDDLSLSLLERPNPEWSIRRVNQAAYDNSGTEEVLNAIAALPELSEAWRAQTIASRNAISSKRSTARFNSFVLQEASFESASIRSLVFVPAAGGEVTIHQPGQHVQIRMSPQTGQDPVVRRYTISSSPNGRSIRISVKAENGGLISPLLHQLEIGDKIDISGPQGRFVLDRDAGRPVAFISAGVGITPMIPMLNAAISQDGKYPFIPKVLFLHTARNGVEHAFARQVGVSLAKHPNASSKIFYSQPNEDDRADRQFDFAGRMTIGEVVDEVTTEYDIYLCGPAAFMKDLSEGLKARGIHGSRIKSESFNVGVDHAKVPIETLLKSSGVIKSTAVVTFATSGVVLSWTPEAGTLLDLAQAAGLTVASDCRLGLCGTCASTVLEGEVAHPGLENSEPGPSQALLCCAVPTSSSVVLDL
jgi:MOSC domain-containing protein YiiM/ferredoxin-NADP reductase